MRYRYLYEVFLKGIQEINIVKSLYGRLGEVTIPFQYVTARKIA